MQTGSEKVAMFFTSENEENQQWMAPRQLEATFKPPSFSSVALNSGSFKLVDVIYLGRSEHSSH